MAVLADLIRFTTPTTGTGTLTVGAAVSPFLTPLAYGAPFNTGTTSVFYSIIDVAGGNSETGTGTYTATGATLSRTPVASTNGGGLINLSGRAQVMFTAIASAIVNKSGDTGIGALSISDTTVASTTAGSGSFVTAGGINVGKNIITNSTASVQVQSGSSLPLYLLNANPSIGFNLYFTNAQWNFGAGSSQNWGGIIDVDAASGLMNFWTVTTAGNENAAATINNFMHIHPAGQVHVTTTTASTSVTTGSFIADGGVGVGGQINCGSINSGSSTAILGSNATIVTSGSSSQTATLTNAPATGNPTKWLPYNDNGVIRYIPSW